MAWEQNDFPTTILKGYRKMATKKDRLGDGKINTGIEMIEDQEEKVWEQNPMEALRYEKIETRKKLNWMARYVLSMIIVLTFLF